jgi:hypothetical protein
MATTPSSSIDASVASGGSTCYRCGRTFTTQQNLDLHFFCYDPAISGTKIAAFHDSRKAQQQYGSGRARHQQVTGPRGAALFSV